MSNSTPAQSSRAPQILKGMVLILGITFTLVATSGFFVPEGSDPAPILATGIVLAVTIGLLSIFFWFSDE